MSFVQQFALAGVDAGTDLDPQCFGVSAQGLGAPDRVSGAVERERDGRRRCS